jgi:hypothetical protein
MRVWLGLLALWCLRRTERLKRFDRATREHRDLPAGQGWPVEFFIIVGRPLKIPRQRHG